MARAARKIPAGHIKSLWTDREILEVLDAADRTRLSGSEIAKVLSLTLGRSVTRDAVLGIVHRVNRAHDAVPCLCKEPENMDGALRPRWWDQ